MSTFAKRLTRAEIEALARYYADLPKLAGKPLEGLPRVYGIAWAYVAHTDSVLDPLVPPEVEIRVEIVWDPPWSPDKMAPEAREHFGWKK